MSQYSTDRTAAYELNTSWMNNKADKLLVDDTIHSEYYLSS